MKLRSKILVLALSLCLCLSDLFGFVTEVNAEEYSEGTVTVEDVLAGMASPSQLGMSPWALNANAPLADGTYYLNGEYSGDYLRYSSSTLSAVSGQFFDLNPSIQWIITNVGGSFTIKFAGNTSKYLADPTSSTSSSSVQIVTVTGTTIPDECLWDISLAANGGCIVQNVYNSRYLNSYGDTVSTVAAAPTPGEEGYKSYVWRVAGTSYISGRELTDASDFNTLVMPLGTSDSPVLIKSPFNAVWAAPSDFEYWLAVNSYTSEASGVFSGNAEGVTTVIATHKVTDLKFVFAVVVGNQPQLTIKNYFDHGFEERYRRMGVYDCEDMLESYNTLVEETFEQFFGIICTFVLNGPFESSADECKKQRFGDNPDNWNLEHSPCTHGEEHLDHGKIRYSAARASETEGETDEGEEAGNVTVVIWTGHVTGGGAEWNEEGSSTVIPFWRVRDEQPDLPLINKRYAFEFIHELSHQLGAYDHYCYNDKVQTPCTNQWCEYHVGNLEPCETIMGEIDDYNLLATFPVNAWYCPVSLQEINNHSATYYQR